MVGKWELEGEIESLPMVKATCPVHLSLFFNYYKINEKIRQYAITALLRL
jgi:hypothetical protein